MMGDMSEVNMSLACEEFEESGDDCSSTLEAGISWSHSDRNILDNDRVLSNLMHTENSYSIQCDYIRKIQDQITEDNRKVLASWMSEVCEEQRCGDIVLPLAMNYVDRFLSKVRITKEQFQLLGSVCLILSSKLRQYRSFTVEQMVYYSDYSCSAKDLMEWELLVLNHLGWDISSVTSNDFLDHILYRIDLPKQHKSIVKKHAQVFITLCSTEYAFTQWKPSTLACASIVAAADGLPWLQKHWRSLAELLQVIKEITNIEPAYLQQCVEKIEELVKLGMLTLQQSESEDPSKPSSKFSSTMTSSQSTTTTKFIDTGTEPQPETPTDTIDITF